MNLSRIIKPRMSGDDVKWLKTRLKDLGLFSDEVDDYYSETMLVAITTFQKVNGIKVDGDIGLQTWSHISNYKTEKKVVSDIPNNVNHVVKDGLFIYSAISSVNYYEEVTDKKAIIISNTGSEYDPNLVIESWVDLYKKDDDLEIILNRGKFESIKRASNYVIGRSSKKTDIWDGKVIKAFDDKYWSYHIDLNKKSEIVNSQTISIDVCNYGPLTKGSNGVFYTKSNIEVDSSDVVILEKEFMGHSYWHKYTDLQISNLRKLLIYLQMRFGIMIDRGSYKGDKFVPYCDNKWFAYKKTYKLEGVKNRTNLLVDNFGLFPQKEMVEMLNTI